MSGPKISCRLSDCHCPGGSRTNEPVRSQSLITGSRAFAIHDDALGREGQPAYGQTE